MSGGNKFDKLVVSNAASQIKAWYREEVLKGYQNVKVGIAFKALINMT